MGTFIRFLMWSFILGANSTGSLAERITNPKNTCAPVLNVIGNLTVTLIVWVGLIKHFFDASWGKAILIGIVAIIVLVIVAFVLTLLGAAALIGLGGLGF